MAWSVARQKGSHRRLVRPARVPRLDERRLRVEARVDPPVGDGELVLAREGVAPVAATFDAAATPKEIARPLPTVGLATAYAAVSWILDNRKVVDPTGTRAWAALRLPR